MVIFGSVRFGVSPAIKATVAMILGITLSSIVLAYLVLCRTAQGRATTAMPGV